MTEFDCPEGILCIEQDDKIQWQTNGWSLVNNFKSIKLGIKQIECSDNFFFWLACHILVLIMTKNANS